MKNLIIIAAAFMLIMACEPKKNNDYSHIMEVHEKAIKIHDEVMLEMDNIYNNRQQMQKAIDSLALNETNNEDKLQEAREIVQHLQRADDEMMNWMHNHKMVPDSLESAGDSEVAEVMSQQQAQYEEIKMVDSLIRSSMAEAKAFLEH